jgi:hypothetical protein
MPGSPLSQTRAGANQFDGTIGLGRIQFTRWDGLAANVRIVLTNAAYRCVGLGAGNVSCWLTPRNGTLDDGIILFKTLEADIENPVDGADISTCGRVVPRQPSAGDPNVWEHWDVVLVTETKTDDATFIVDFLMRNYADDLPV